MSGTCYHQPVMLRESIDALRVSPTGTYVDVTFGGGGHSGRLLQQLTTGHLFAMDQDEDALRNAPSDPRLTLMRGNFRYLRNFLRYEGAGPVDGLIADLGVSSHHFDTAERGFSFRFDAPLDMRMNQRSHLTAAEVVNNYGEQQLADVLHTYGQLRQARAIAKAIVQQRAQTPIATTGQLAELVAPLLQTPSSLQRHTATGAWPKDMAQVFQALRIEVNHEMEALSAMLEQAVQVIKPGGRLVVITYHSLEDRMVKNLMRTGNTAGLLKKDFYGHVAAPLRPTNNKVLTPSAQEQAANPRSRSAKLRVAERVSNA